MANLSSMKFNEDEMLSVLSEQLLPGEALCAAVYCAFSDTGFFATRIPVYGYLGITDRSRLIACQAHLTGIQILTADLNFAKKLTVKTPVFGSLFKQKEVYAECLGERTVKLKFTVIRKIAGKKFPNQPENAETLLRLIAEKQQQLHL